LFRWLASSLDKEALAKDLGSLLVNNSDNRLGNSLPPVLQLLALVLPHHLAPPPLHPRQVLDLDNLKLKLRCNNSNQQQDLDLDKLKLPLSDSKQQPRLLHLEEHHLGFQIQPPVAAAGLILMPQLQHLLLLLHLHLGLLISAVHCGNKNKLLLLLPQLQLL
jgi:hypothetical protein